MFGRNSFGKNVGMFNVNKPTRSKKVAKAGGFGRPAIAKRDIGVAIASIKKTISSKITAINSPEGVVAGINVNASNAGAFSELLSFAQTVGLSVSGEGEIDSILSELASYANGVIRPLEFTTFRGVVIFTKMDDMVRYFLAPVAKAVYRAKGSIQAGKIADFAGKVITFVSAVGSKSKGAPSMGFNAWDWAILAVGVNSAASIPGVGSEVNNVAGQYASYPAVAGGFIAYASTAGRTGTGYRAVKSRVKLEFVQAGALAKNLLPRLITSMDKEGLSAIGRVVASAAEGGATGIGSSLALTLVKNSKLKSLVGDYFLLKSIVGFFGKGSFGNVFNYGKNAVAGIALTKGSSIENSLPSGKNLLRFSARSMAGRMLVYGLINYMLKSMESNPTAFANESGRAVNEVAPVLKALLGGAEFGKREYVGNFKRFTKGIVFYMRTDVGGFASALNSAAGNKAMGAAEYKALARALGLTSRAVSAGPAFKATKSDILGGGSVSGFRGNNVGGCGLFGKETSGLFGEEKTRKGFGRRGF